MQILLSECRTLTPVAVAVKLSVDLNTSLLRPQDQLGKLSSSVFLYTVMGNSMPSIGATENKDMLINTVACFIIVNTTMVNICIQLGTGKPWFGYTSCLSLSSSVMGSDYKWLSTLILIVQAVAVGLGTVAPVSSSSEDFKGVIEFDSDLVSSLDSEETPNSWALPLVTLTSIAVSPPGIDHNSTKQLRRTVQEGLMYVRKVESKFDAQKELMAIKKAAETVCLRVDLNHKWLDVDLHKIDQGQIKLQNYLSFFVPLAPFQKFVRSITLLLWEHYNLRHHANPWNNKAKGQGANNFLHQNLEIIKKSALISKESSKMLHRLYVKHANYGFPQEIKLVV
ncbi:hypothetical protein LguiA_034157 [Lonicera macranthoides]